ncbi:hypothetical protein D3C81_984030 [compost metagenome]
MLRTLVQRVHALNFQRGRGNQQFATDIERDLVLAAERLGCLGATLAQVSLEAAGGVIDTRMDHATVVSGLMPGQARFLFQDQQ